MFKLQNPKFIEVKLHGQMLGRIALTPDKVAAFEYSPEYLASSVSVSPLELPLTAGVKMAKPTPFDRNFGVFDDSLPDGWGLLILSRYLNSIGIDPKSLSLLQLLSITGSNGRGALEYFPEQSVQNTAKEYDLNILANEAQKIYKSADYYGENLQQLFVMGGSPGGARPKISICFQNKEWLVKFRASNDPENIGFIEYQYSLLAKKCGIEMPETQLLENRYFATARFDRVENHKIHVVSVAALLNANYQTPCLDYLDIFRLCLYITNNWTEMWKLFRLMTFNYLIGNKDDHAKNFAFVLRNREWHLSPAFDLLPSSGFNGFHTTSINQKETPTEADIIAVAEKSGLEIKKAKAIFEEIKDNVNHRTSNFKRKT